MRLAERIKILMGVYIVLVVSVIVYAMSFTDIGDYLNGYENIRAYELDDGWLDSAGAEVSVRHLPALAGTDMISLSRTLPDDILDGDTLNFISHNVRFTIWVGGEEIYRYMPASNITGEGYGESVHMINMAKEYAGAPLEINAYPIYPDESSCGIKSIMLSDPQNYVHIMAARHGMGFLLSLLIIFFGVAVLVVYIVMLRSDYNGPNLLALSLAVIMLGLWTSMQTPIPALFLGASVFLRVLDYGILLFDAYPLVVFVSSVCQKSRMRYELIEFAVTIFTVSCIAVLRYAYGIDVHKVTFIIHASLAFAVCLIAWIIIKNEIYCREKGIKSNLTLFYIGAVIFMVGAITDLIVYNASGKSVDDAGRFLRIGMALFIIFMFVQILQWFSREQQINDRQKFLTDLMNYSVSERSAEETINLMLEYLGKELYSDRAYIFEDKLDGYFDNTYEWCREGVTPEKDNLQHVPYDGLIDVWYEEFKKHKHIVIRDIEKYKEVSEPMYNLLKPQGINSLVTAPLEIDGKLLGFFGLDNPPQDKINEVSDIISLLEYFMSVTVRQRDNQQLLRQYSYRDQLTGVLNRRALEEYIKNDIENNASYGVLMCDINGLKRTNDLKGHDAGDQMIWTVARALGEVFGMDNVYRLGGDEFLAIAGGGTETAFATKVRTARLLYEAKGMSASMGFSFHSDGDERDFLTHEKEADELMYADKQAYYEGHRDRRDRHRSHA